MAVQQESTTDVLLVCDEFGTSKGGISTINRQLARILSGAGRKVHCTVLEATEEDKADAVADGVELVFPKISVGDGRRPTLHWLTYDHQYRYPILSKNIGCIVGHVDITGQAAAAIQEERFPTAELVLVNHVIPEDTEHYKGGEKAMGIGRKESSTVRNAAKATTVFSVGQRIFNHFQNQYRALGADAPRHYLLLPKPSELFEGTQVLFEEANQKIVLSIGRVRKVEKLKGHDLAGTAMERVAERGKSVKWRLRGISEEDYQASKDILDAHLKTHKLNPTLLPYGTQKDICNDIKQAHLVLMPSRSEPFGLVGLEAMAAGVPVLISDQSGLANLLLDVAPEFYHSIVKIEGNDEQDSKRWAEKIESTLENSKAAFRSASALKQKLLESRYWEESHQTFLRACCARGAEKKPQAVNFQRSFSRTEGRHTELLQQRERNPDGATGYTTENQDYRLVNSTNRLTISSDQDNVQKCDIFHRTIDRAEKLFRGRTLESPDNFEKAVASFVPHIEVLLATDRDLYKPRLSVEAKLSIARRVDQTIDLVEDEVFTDTVMANLELYERMVACLKKFEATVKKAERGCVLCHLEFEGTSSVKTFLRAHKNGDMSKILTKELVTRKDLYINVTLAASPSQGSTLVPEVLTLKDAVLYTKTQTAVKPQSSPTLLDLQT